MVYYYEDSDEYLEWLNSSNGEPNYDEMPEMYKTKQLRLYNTETWEYTVLADKDKDDYSSPSDPAYGYGSKVCYLCGNTLYVADANTGEATPIVTPENKVVNFWMLDNKVFYITNLDDKEKSAYFYFYDLTDEVSVQLENKGNTEYMLFSTGTEGNEYFVETGGKIISKEDFYNENY